MLINCVTVSAWAGELGRCKTEMIYHPGGYTELLVRSWWAPLHVQGFLLPKTKSGIESLVQGWLSYPDQDTFGQHTKHRQQERQSTQIPARSTTINSTIPAIPHTCKLSYAHKIMQASKSHEYNSVPYTTAMEPVLSRNMPVITDISNNFPQQHNCYLHIPPCLCGYCKPGC